MQIALAILLILHGIAHFVGFAGAFGLGEAGKQPPRTALFGGRLQLSPGQIKLGGIVWLLLGAAFIAAGTLLLIGFPYWRALASSISLLSLLMCMAYWPEARIGLWLNLLLLGAIASGLVR